MISVGIDLDSKRSHMAPLDEHGGELLSPRIANDPDTFLALLDGLDGESKRPSRRKSSGERRIPMGMPVRRSQKSRPAAGPSLLLFAARHLDGHPVGSRDAALVSLSRRGA
jgi:hypothetical protein